MKFPFISTLITGWQLAHVGYAKNYKKDRKKEERKIIFYILLNPIFASKWFKLLKSEDFKFVFLHRPHLFMKPFRVYISIKWGKNKIVKVISDTYRFLKRKENLFQKVLGKKDGFNLAKLTLSETTDAFLNLGYDKVLRKEGELVLSLISEQLGGKIVSVAFSFEEIEDNNWVCIIGCVQAHTNNYSDDSFKLMQKLMHGFRPNSFIIYSLQELSRHLGCSTIHATGDAIQAYRKKHAIHLPWAHKIHFDYDRFWKEVGGNNIGKGWFELPLNHIRKDIQEIKSKKRAMYRRRYDMMDNISLQIVNSIKKASND